MCRQDRQGIAGLITCLLGAGADVNVKSVPPVHAHSSLRGMTPLTMILEMASSEAKSQRSNHETSDREVNLKKNSFVICRSDEEAVGEGDSKKRMEYGPYESHNDHWMVTAQHLLQSGGLHLLHFTLFHLVYSFPPIWMSKWCLRNLSLSPSFPNILIFFWFSRALSSFHF